MMQSIVLLVMSEMSILMIRLGGVVGMRASFKEHGSDDMNSPLSNMLYLSVHRLLSPKEPKADI